MKLSNLSKNDKLAIAEFLHAFSSDLLIKSDVVKVIDVLKNHKIKNAENLKIEVIPVLNLVNQNIDITDRKLIMDAYYSNTLY